MNNLTFNIFRYKKVNFDKLKRYGFVKDGGVFCYRACICNGMSLNIRVNSAGEVSTKVIDGDGEEEYTLFLVEGAEGEFVGRVRADYVRIMEDVADKCFDGQVFKCAHTASVIEYARSNYGDELEFLWADSPDCAIIRRRDTNKWYAVIMTVAYRKLGINKDGDAEVINMRMPPAELDALVDNVRYFRGWHMNKKHWASMLLDGACDLKEIEKRVDVSYALALK